MINYLMVLQVMIKGRRSGHSALRVINSQKEKRRKGGGEEKTLQPEVGEEKGRESRTAGGRVIFLA